MTTSRVQTIALLKCSMLNMLAVVEKNLEADASGEVECCVSAFCAS